MMITPRDHPSDPTPTDEVILVDERDKQIGTLDKIEAHQGGGRLHRAFSICVFNAGGELLLQKRKCDKPTFGGLWSNTCCSHPRPGETVTRAAHRRLREELGFDTDLRGAWTFIYKAADPRTGLVEYEYDHTLLGRYDGDVTPNAGEIDDVRWVPFAELTGDIANSPDQYTPWLRIIVEKLGPSPHAALE